MVFPWSFSDGMSPLVCRTLLSILAVFNNAVVWMVSIRPPTSMSSRPFNNTLLCQKHQSQLVQSSPSYFTAFSILEQSRGTYPSFHILSVLFCGQPGHYPILRVFHISVSWWFFTGVLVTAHLLKYPGLFSVFWPTLIML